MINKSVSIQDFLTDIRHKIEFCATIVRLNVAIVLVWTGDRGSIQK